MKSSWSALVCLSVVVLVALTSAGLAQPQTVPRELAQRLIGSGATLFVGELPPENRLGFNFPMPQRTRVVGANASTEADATYSYMVLYLSSEQRVADVKAFYHQAFRDLGWRSGQTYQTTGFLPSGLTEPDNTLTFCRIKGDTASDVNFGIISRQQTTLIDANINTYTNTDGSGPCSEESNYVEPPIPALVAPGASASSVVENLSGSGQGNGGSVIVLETALSAQELLEHYAQQLELSGWQAEATAESSAVQFTTYRFRSGGDAFVGTLQVVPLAHGRYSAQVTVVNP